MIKSDRLIEIGDRVKRIYFFFSNGEYCAGYKGVYYNVILYETDKTDGVYHQLLR